MSNNPDPTPAAESWLGLSENEDQEIALEELERIGSDSPSPLIENVLRMVGNAFHGVDKLKKETVREVVIKKLRAVGIKSVARMVDAALKPPPSSNQAFSSQGRAVAFPEVKSWPDPVDGNALFNEVKEILARHVVFSSEGCLTTTALWVGFTWVYDCFDSSPMLAVVSPVKRCGKTTLLTILNALVHKPALGSNITSAVLFRLVEQEAPTLLIDEADTFIRDREELSGILNSGHTRETAYVFRSVGETFEPRRFSTWCPKAVALIGKLKDTLADRSLPVVMRRRMKDEPITRVKARSLKNETGDVKQQLKRWGEDDAEKLSEIAERIKAPDRLNDRQADNWRVLFAIAECIGGKWPERLNQACAELTEDYEDDSAGIMLLEDIRTLFQKNQTDRLTTDSIIRELVKMESRPWPECSRGGHPITARGIAKLLKPFKILPKTIRLYDGGGTSKGYMEKDFKEAFSRYLSKEGGVYPSQRHNPTKADLSEDFSSVTDSSVLRTEKGEKPLNINDVSDVTDKKGVYRGEDMFEEKAYL